MWYAAHVIMAFKYRTAPQKEIPVWENIVLVEANSAEEAWKTAEKLGREEDDPDLSLTWNGIPTQLTFVGIRKIVSCLEGVPGDENVLATGTEVSYSLMTV